MIRKRRRPTSNPERESVRQAAIAARDAARQGEEIELDPASELFFAFAGPLLLQARSDEEFSAAAEIAEFVWFSTHFDVASQVELVQQFITEREIPDEMVPWLLDVFAELSVRKQVLAG